MSAEEKKECNLVKKLARIMKQIDRVPKNGYNEFHKYNYATEADIAEHCRNLLATENIILIPNVLKQEQISKVNKDGETRNDIARLTVEFTFFDGDSGERISFTMIGDGEDKGDKAPYKAITGAQKYALMKSFLIPTGDDPENENGDKKPAFIKKSENKKQEPVTKESPSSKTYRLKSVSDIKVSQKSGKNYYDVHTTDGDRFWIGEKDDQVLRDAKYSCSENLNVIMLVNKQKRIEKIEPVLGMADEKDVPEFERTPSEVGHYI